VPPAEPPNVWRRSFSTPLVRLVEIGIPGVSGVGRHPDRPSWGIPGLPFLAKGRVPWPGRLIGRLGTHGRRRRISARLSEKPAASAYVTEQ
jgi:hypothetical protein